MNVAQKLLKLVKICRSRYKNFTATYFMYEPQCIPRLYAMHQTMKQKNKHA